MGITKKYQCQPCYRLRKELKEAGLAPKNLTLFKVRIYNNRKSYMQHLRRYHPEWSVPLKPGPKSPLKAKLYKKGMEEEVEQEVGIFLPRTVGRPSNSFKRMHGRIGHGKAGPGRGHTGPMPTKKIVRPPLAPKRRPGQQTRLQDSRRTTASEGAKGRVLVPKFI